jgi:hypothetical protein
LVQEDTKNTKKKKKKEKEKRERVNNAIVLKKSQIFKKRL